MDVSVVTIGWNEAGEVDGFTDDLESLDCPSECELVAVVGGEDETYSQMKKWCEVQSTFSKTTILEQKPDNGFVGALTRAFSESTGEKILHVEMDTTLPSSWIRDMISGLEPCDAVSCDPSPRGGWSLYWAIEWMDDRANIGRGRSRLSSAQTLGLRRPVAEDVIINDPLPEHLVDWHIDKRVANRGYSIGRVPTTVGVRLAEERNSYDGFLKWQYNRVSDDDFSMIQIFKHLAIIASPLLTFVCTLAWYFTGQALILILTIPFISVIFAWINDELECVREAAQAAPSAWRKAPSYLVARWVFQIARIHIIARERI